MNKERSFGTSGLASQDQLEPIFNERQLELRKCLMEIDKELGYMYMGCLWALLPNASSKNPERMVHAAHSLREIIEKLHMHYDFPIQSYKLTDKVRELRDHWRKLKKGSRDFDCSSDRLRLPPKKILNKLRVFMKKVCKFFEDFDGAYPTFKSSAKNFLGFLDPRSDEFPKSILDSRIEEWRNYRNWFTSVAHHRIIDVGEDEFRKQLFRFEIFLSGLIAPSYTGINELKQIIDKAKDE